MCSVCIHHMKIKLLTEQIMLHNRKSFFTKKRRARLARLLPCRRPITHDTEMLVHAHTLHGMPTIDHYDMLTINKACFLAPINPAKIYKYLLWIQARCLRYSMMQTEQNVEAKCVRYEALHGEKAYLRCV